MNPDGSHAPKKKYLIYFGLLVSLILVLFYFTNLQRQRIASLRKPTSQQRSNVSAPQREGAISVQEPEVKSTVPPSEGSSRRVQGGKRLSDAEFEVHLKTNLLKRRSTLDYNYNRLFRKLGLPPKDIERLKDLMSALVEAGDRANRERSNRGLAPLTSQDWQELEKANLAQIHDFLGDKGYQEYKYFVETRPLQGVVTMTQSGLNGSGQLSDLQCDQIVEAMRNAGITRLEKSNFNEDVFQSIKKITTPEQLRAFWNVCVRVYGCKPMDSP